MSAGTTASARAELRRRMVPAIVISLAAGLALLVPAPQAAFAASPGPGLISAGFGDSCAIESGRAYSWGNNSNGQLGEGSETDSSVPVAVNTSGALAGKTLTQIATGQGATCALDGVGAAYCWGWNGDGGLGDDSAAAQSTVPVLAGPQAPASVTATPGDTTATVSWTAPADLDGGTLTGYTAAASPSGADCTTTGATICIITGLTDGITYSITVVAHTTGGDSGASRPASVTPVGGVGGLAFTSGPAYTATSGRRSASP